jgi:hypothetical protein
MLAARGPRPRSSPGRGLRFAQLGRGSRAPLRARAELRPHGWSGSTDRDVVRSPRRAQGGAKAERRSTLPLPTGDQRVFRLRRSSMFALRPAALFEATHRQRRTRRLRGCGRSTEHIRVTSRVQSPDAGGRHRGYEAGGCLGSVSKTSDKGPCRGIIAGGCAPAPPFHRDGTPEMSLKQEMGTPASKCDTSRCVAGGRLKPARDEPGSPVA